MKEVEVQPSQQVIGSKKVERRPRQKMSVREMTIIGMLGGITMFLGMTGFGFIVLPWMKATILQIPTIIGALVEGPRVGVFVGLIFGMSSLYQNLVVQNVFSVFFINPMVSVLPRILIGPMVYLAYKFIRIPNEYLRLAVAAAVGSLTNTIGVLGMIYILYAQEFAAAKHLPVDRLINILLGIAVANGGTEAIVTALVVTPVILMLRKALAKKGSNS